MTPDQALEAAAVMVAFANGQKIEIRHKKFSDDWTLDEDPLWNLGCFDYRVAPEPWKGKIWVHPDGQAHQQTFFTHSADGAIREGWRLIEAKEVAE